VIVAVGFLVTFEPDSMAAILVAVGLTSVLLPLLRRQSPDPGFITKVFLGSAALRVAFGVFVYAFDLRGYFGGDALTYDFKGSLIVDYWHGLVPPDTPALVRAMTTNGPGWGMNYLVAFIYYIFGKNFLAAQTFTAMIGAAVAPLVYICS